VLDPLKRNVALLAICQTLLFFSNATLITITAVAGSTLALNKSLATLPVTAWVLGMALATLPASMFMKRFGRRAGFMVAALIGLAGAALCVFAIHRHDFWLLCAGMVMFGVYGGTGLFYRFAAVDTSPPEFRSTAISLVMAGGLIGGYFGPELSKLTVNLFPIEHLGTYLSIVVYVIATLVVLTMLDIPAPTTDEQYAKGRSLRAIAAQPTFVVAVIGAALGFGMMNFLMVAAPLAMKAHGHEYNDYALVIQWHVIAMFAPSFFTGFLIKRFGVLNLMFAGVVIFAACIAAALAGITVAHFWVALALLGIGWNFLFIGGTTLLTETYEPAERAKTQGVNDFAITLTQLVTSVTSGWMLERSGWEFVNYLAMPLVATMGFAIVWLMISRRRHVVA
jgi:MFS family permease